ncbi:MAG: pyruvate kinase [Tissierellia bacterium]|nr:pyruvate kinase [Tissierellia bacterium]
MKKTKIVATIGPASWDKEILKQLFYEGVNVCRLNFSHGTQEEHKKHIEIIKEVREDLNLPIGIMIDTKGPEIRLGTFEHGLEVTLKPGDIFTFTTEEIIGTKEIVSVSYSYLPYDVKAGDRILVDDGLVELEVIEINGNEIKCEAKNEGVLKDHKGMNVPGIKTRLPSLTDKDKEDILFGVREDVDFIAASFIRKKEDILKIRKILEDAGNFDIQIIAKIENQEGVENMDEIIAVADGIMVARGDLGVEIETEAIPLVQKELIRKSVEHAKPVITATQMLDSMMRNPRPTRAEVTDVANAIFDGTSAIMLSGETASGKYPVEAVRTMKQIALKTESALSYEELLEKRSQEISNTTTNSIGKSTCFIAKELDAKAIITATSSGYTSRAISKFKPKAPIIAATTSQKVLRQLSLDWGVYGILAPYSATTDSVISVSIEEAKKEGFIKEGDLVVLTAGLPVGLSGTTNLIKVHTIAKTIGKGMGIGDKSAVGRACVVRNSEELVEKFHDGDILVIYNTSQGMIPYVERASGIISVEGGLTSSAAIVGLNMEKPTIVGVDKALDLIPHGEMITMDSSTGQIYSGQVDVK